MKPQMGLKIFAETGVLIHNRERIVMFLCSAPSFLSVFGCVRIHFSFIESFEAAPSNDPRPFPLFSIFLQLQLRFHYKNRFGGKHKDRGDGYESQKYHVKRSYKAESR